MYLASSLRNALSPSSCGAEAAGASAPTLSSLPAMRSISSSRDTSLPCSSAFSSSVSARTVTPA